jgi:hypothetical protein
MGMIITEWDKCRGEVTLIFHHIPKTAGSTLNAVIDGNYERSTVFRVESPIVPSLEKFKALPSEERRRLRVVRGHAAWGLHEHLDGPCVYVTMLRDPVDRVVSNYYFVLSSPKHNLHEQVVSGNLSLKDYVEKGVNRQMDNGQVRALSGKGTGLGDAVGYGECTQDMLELAKHNLSNGYALAGLTERFDVSLLLMKRLLGWKKTFYRRQKVTRERPSLSEIARDARLAIEDRNRFDLELYRLASKLFERHLEKQSILFPLEVAAFRTANLFRNRVR